MFKSPSTSIYTDIIQGKFDQEIFGDPPQLTPDVNLLIKQYPRAFIRHLFARCKSRETLDFWLGKVQLPEDTLGLLVESGNNIHAAKYLKEKGWFSGIDEEDKEYLLKRAKIFEQERFKGLDREDFKYLCQELAPDPSAPRRKPLFPPIL